jgi:1-deoxy-D-xylulose 5-phosphate reductoisomerase
MSSKGCPDETGARVGSTGSISPGLRSSPFRELEVVGLSCGSRIDLLLEQATSLGVNDVAVADARRAHGVGNLYPELRVRRGADAAERLVREVEADLVLNAIVGFAGLAATVAALQTERPLALANKESLVSGGAFVTGLAAAGGCRCCPWTEHLPFTASGREMPEAVTLLSSLPGACSMSKWRAGR